MKQIFSIKKIIFIFFFCLLFSNQSFSKDKKIPYDHDQLSNYLIGTISITHNQSKQAYQYLSKTKLTENGHANFKTKFVQTLVELNKIEEAFKYLRKLNEGENDFYDASLLLGINALKNRKFIIAEKYFSNLENFPVADLNINKYLISSLKSFVNAYSDNQKKAFQEVDKLPVQFKKLKLINKSFLNCYFDTNNTKHNFENLIKQSKFNYSRYNFFLVNYLVKKNRIDEAKLILNKGIKFNESNLLLNQSNIFLNKEHYYKITKIFDCQNIDHLLSELFYLMANLYSSEEEFKSSNFYLKLSIFLNKNFYQNHLLLAENYFKLGNYELAKKIYKDIINKGELYSWYANKQLTRIFLVTKNKDEAIKHLKKEFDKIKNPSTSMFYDLANYYKDSEYYKESIKYYTLVLNRLNNDKNLLPKVLEKRGTSYERIKSWKEAENDLKESLRLEPDQPYVLNYLAYSWLERKINIDESLKMLTLANDLQQNDPFILDSLGWAKYLSSKYVEAEKLLRKAIKIMPFDPIINDHYADVLWKLKKNIQARYFWQNVLNFEDTDDDLRKKVKKKLSKGIT